MEYLNYIRLEETEFDYEVIVQLDGGGVLQTIPKTSDSRGVAGALRFLAELIDESVAKRDHAHLPLERTLDDDVEDMPLYPKIDHNRQGRST